MEWWWAPTTKEEEWEEEFSRISHVHRHGFNRESGMLWESHVDQFCGLKCPKQAMVEIRLATLGT